MPINAKPEYYKAEKKYFEASSIAEKLKALEGMLSKAPSHKGAETLRAGIKQKLAKFRGMLEKERTKGKGQGFSLTIKKEGAAQAMILSLTNAGKSSLLTKLTNAKPQIKHYEYTTEKPEVGIMEYNGVQIQLIELPAIFPDYAYRGNGPTYFSAMRNSDLIIFLIDLSKDINEQLEIIHGEFEKAQIKLNQERPPVEIKKTGVGGIEFSGRRFIKFDIKEARKLLKENNFHNALIDIYGPVTIEQFADALNESITYLPLLIIYNKSDIKGKGISCKTGEGVEEIKTDIWNSLGIIKVFTKQPGKEKEHPPIALKVGSQIKDIAQNVHKDFIKKFKFARVWGTSVKHPGNMVGLEHTLHDEDIVELHLK